MSLKRSVFILMMFLAVAPGAWAGEEASPAALRAQLKALEAEIADYRKQLEATRAEKSRVEAELRENEKKINQLLNRIKELEEALETGQRQTQALKAEQLALEADRTRQQRLLEQQLRAAHRIGSQEHLKLLLSQESPAEAARMLKFYEYFAEARAGQLAALKATLAELAEVGGKLTHANERRSRNLSELRRQQLALAAAQTERRSALAALTREQAVTGRRIQQLGDDRKQLEGLLSRIASGVRGLPLPSRTSAFAALQGQLLLPVHGQVAQAYGSQRSGGQLRWKGLLIAAAEGEPVHAIHDGQVVFSDWLRGFGLLLILNHGEGYMSLYGHNQALYRQAGDQVAQDDVIAIVGGTGGQRAPGLYFEIRSQGQPTDPALWCQARPAV